MLQHLQVRDLVIVRELFLDLQPGMTVLTGETGAGKSILIDALGLALGGKADKRLVRPGCEKAEVSAVFDLEQSPAARQWLEAQDLSSDGECILRRVLVRKGRSRAFINGRPATQALLAELGDRLVEIHGQHEHQRLLRPAVQRTLLDAWAGHDELLGRVTRAHARWREARRQLDRLREETEERARRMDYLRFQIGELQELAPSTDELQQLEREQRRLANADELGSEVNRLLQRLLEDDQAVQPRLSQATADSHRLAELAGELAPAAELLESARIQVEEAVALLQEFGSGIEHDPERLAQVDRRLGALHDMARKHRVQPEQLEQLLRDLEADLTTLEEADHSLAALEAALDAAGEEYRQACEKLRQSRRRAAAGLSEIITASMQELAMEGGRFEIEVSPLAGSEGAAHGMDQVIFQVSTNPGMPLASLAEVASGGELSRLSLAIQVATSSLGSAQTLIFDEVDVGIGGAVAETVGRLLRELGSTRQVLCITHLPQVAARGQHHLRVFKERSGKSTRTGIEPLDKDQRVREIARMVGGSRISRKSLAHAEELIVG